LSLKIKPQRRNTKNNRLILECQSLSNIQFLNHLAEIIIVNLAGPALITFDNGPIHYLLQLDIVQIFSNHQLQNMKQISIRDEAILIFIIDVESEPDFVFFIPIGALIGQPLHKFHK
jgi:hypothetical protein